MRVLLIAALMILHLNALDKLSTIGKDQQEVLDFVLKKLDLSNTAKKNKDAIYDKIDFALKESWYTNSMDNNTPELTKVGDADTKFIELTALNNNRIHAFTFIHFKKQKQVMVITRQYISSDSKTLLEKFEDIKKDTKFKKLHETDNYAYFNKDGYMSDLAIHIDGKEGMIAYIDMTTIEL